MIFPRVQLGKGGNLARGAHVVDPSPGVHVFRPTSYGRMGGFAITGSLRSVGPSEDSTPLRGCSVQCARRPSLGRSIRGALFLLFPRDRYPAREPAWVPSSPLKRPKHSPLAGTPIMPKGHTLSVSRSYGYLSSKVEEEEAGVSRESIKKQDPPNAHQAQHRPKTRFDECTSSTHR